MSTITVLPSTLEDVAEGLGGFGGELLSLAKLPPTSAKALGGSQVQGAVESFHGDWGYAISQLADGMQNVINNLHQAALQYQRTEACTTAQASW